MAILPATGTTITMGGVFHAYTNVTAGTGTGSNMSVRATLGPYIGITTGSISLSSSFGGRTTTYSYP